MGNKSKALKWLGKFLAEVLLNAAIQAIIDVLSFITVMHVSHH
jgi:hypothetical protein